MICATKTNIKGTTADNVNVTLSKMYKITTIIDYIAGVTNYRGTVVRLYNNLYCPVICMDQNYGSYG